MLLFVVSRVLQARLYLTSQVSEAHSWVALGKDIFTPAVDRLGLLSQRS